MYLIVLLLSGFSLYVILLYVIMLNKYLWLFVMILIWGNFFNILYYYLMKIFLVILKVLNI